MLAALKASSTVAPAAQLPTHVAAAPSGLFTPVRDPYAEYGQRPDLAPGRPASSMSRIRGTGASYQTPGQPGVPSAGEDVVMSGVLDRSMHGSKSGVFSGSSESGGLSNLFTKSRDLFAKSKDGQKSHHRAPSTVSMESSASSLAPVATRRSARLAGIAGDTLADSVNPSSQTLTSTSAATGQVPTSFHEPSTSAADTVGFVDIGVWQRLLDFLSCLAAGYYHLQRFECHESIEAFRRLSASQLNTPWVLAQIGKAEYESSNYRAAKEKFSQVRKIAPSRIEDMEVYSAVLWLQKDEIGLGHLSHQLIEFDRLAPQAWLALGNSFSLQRDHDQAIRCFRRAAQLDPKLPAAYTLQGHEHMENEEFEKAERAYRRALHADSRYYHAWYGLGRVDERLDRFEQAEKHYRFAARINPSNAVLVVRIGVVLQKRGLIAQALDQYSVACELDPRPSFSHLARLYKARVLLSLDRDHDRDQEALKELLILRDFAPEVANIHFFLALALQKTGDPRAAVESLTIAWGLDPNVRLMPLSEVSLTFLFGVYLTFYIISTLGGAFDQGTPRKHRPDGRHV